MNAIPALAILLFGIALGACLPILVTTMHAWLRQRQFRPTLLQLDDMPSRRLPPSSQSDSPQAAPPADRQP